MTDSSSISAPPPKQSPSQLGQAPRPRQTAPVEEEERQAEAVEDAPEEGPELAASAEQASPPEPQPSEKRDLATA